MNEFPYSMADVLSLNRIDYPKTSRRVRVGCPFCTAAKKDKVFTINLESGIFNCFRCGVSGRGATTLHAYLHNITTKEAHAEIMEALSLNTTTGKSNVIERTVDPLPPQVEELPLAPAVVLNNTYRNLLEILSLTDRDKKDLLNRGFSEEEIIMLGYKSYPTGDKDTLVSEYFDIPKKLIAKKCQLNGVPGFHVTKNKGVPTMVWRKGGILVPYISYFNTLEGLQLRKHSEELDVYEDGDKEDKYSWISSVNKHKGTALKTIFHYACDFQWDRENTQFTPIISNGIINFTEGAMKADLFHVITGKPIIATAGCSNLSGLEAELLRLKEQKGVHTFCNLYDMDYITNPYVQKDIEKLKDIVENCGLKYVRPVWNAEVNGKFVLKGIDDYYAFIKRNIVPIISE